MKNALNWAGKHFYQSLILYPLLVLVFVHIPEYLKVLLEQSRENSMSLDGDPDPYMTFVFEMQHTILLKLTIVDVVLYFFLFFLIFTRIYYLKKSWYFLVLLPTLFLMINYAVACFFSVISLQIFHLSGFNFLSLRFVLVAVLPLMLFLRSSVLVDKKLDNESADIKKYLAYNISMLLFLGCMYLFIMFAVGSR